MMALGGAPERAGVSLSNHDEEGAMTDRFRRGDRVEWNFRGHTVTGTVRQRLVRRAEVDGRTVAASADDPRYVVQSAKSGKTAVRRGESLRRIT